MAKLVQQITIGYIRSKFKVLSLISKKKTIDYAIELFTTPQFRYNKPLPEIFELSEKLEFRHYGETVTGYRWNRGGHRRVLISHGFNSSVAKFEKYVTPLVKKGYEVLAFDAPAHGFSTGKTLNAIVYRDMIIAINDLYGPVKSFMGHSFGGLAICLAMEEIVHDENYHLVLIAPATESRAAFDNFYSLMQLNDEIKKGVEDFIYGLKKKPVAWYSVSRAIENIKAKILWCHDENDTITPWKDAKLVMDKNHRHIEFLVTKGLGHRRIYREKKVMNAIVDFL